MFKLLPEESRYKVSKEYSNRRMVVMIISLSIIFGLSIIGLFPSLILLNIKKNELATIVGILSSSRTTQEALDADKWLASVNSKLDNLAPELDNNKPLQFVKKVVEKKVLGISITGFRWAKEKEAKVLNVSGVARDRQSLVAFQNSLNISGEFLNVTLPVSNLAKDRDINFQIKLTFKPK